MISIASAQPTLPSGINYYANVVLTNSQSSATTGNFQQMVSFNALAICNAILCSSHLNNTEFFYANGTVIPSWYESASGLSNNYASNSFSTSSNVLAWVLITPANYIPGSGSNTIYLGFAANTVNEFNAIGNTGEAPTLTSSYAQYDNGASVFTYYNPAPASTSGWTVAGVSGQTADAPAGSYFASTNAFYANSVSSDYMYAPIQNLNRNEIITYDAYSTGLGDLFFLASSAGSGQMARLDTRGGSHWAGLATTSSWSSWGSPASGLTESAGTWYKFDIVVGSTTANAYIGPAANTLGSLGTLAKSGFSISVGGNYIGLEGDGLGATYITYWNSFIVRLSPPNGIMPQTNIGNVILAYTPPSTPPTLPSGINYYANVVLTNSQSSATTGNFQQMVSFNALAVCNAILCSSHLNNTEFFYANGTVIPSWYESANGLSNNYGSNTFSTSTDVIAWVLITPANFIPASGSNTISLGFLSNSVNNFNASGNTGEAPTLTSAYGAYDTGNSVFAQYGGGGPNGWGSFTELEGTWDTNNGYLEQTDTTGSYSSGPTALDEASTYPVTGNYVIESAMQYPSGATARGLEWWRCSRGPRTAPVTGSCWARTAGAQGRWDSSMTYLPS